MIQHAPQQDVVVEGKKDEQSATTLGNHSVDKDRRLVSITNGPPFQASKTGVARVTPLPQWPYRTNGAANILHGSFNRQKSLEESGTGGNGKSFDIEKGGLKMVDRETKSYDLSPWTAHEPEVSFPRSGG